MYFSGSWHSICDDGWDTNDAKVVCRQLGLGEAIETPGDSHFGKGNTSIKFCNFQCIGDESALSWCLHSGWKLSGCTCPSREVASVVCEGMMIWFCKEYDIIY